MSQSDFPARRRADVHSQRINRASDTRPPRRSYIIGTAIQVLAVPLLFLSRRENSPSDVMVGQPEPVPAVAGQASGRSDRGGRSPGRPLLAANRSQLGLPADPIERRFGLAATPSGSNSRD